MKAHLTSSLSTPKTVAKILAAVAVLTFLLVGSPTAYAQNVLSTSYKSQIDIMEWEVPWEGSRPRDPYVAPDGMVWFCGQTGAYLASLNPDTGEMKRYELGAGEGPHNLIVAEDGMVWYSGNTKGYIGRLNPITEEITKFPMSDTAARDPHTLVWLSDGNIAFTVQGGNMVGHLDVKTGKVRLTTPAESGSRPYGIKVDPNGEVWVVLFGTNKLAHFDMKGMALHEFEIPRKNARPRRMEITSDGRIWYGDYAGGFLGVFNPQDASFTEYEMPSKVDSRPYGMAVDNNDTIYMVETGVKPNNFIAFDTKSASFTSSALIPSGGGVIRHMYYHEPTGMIWFGTDSNFVGRALVGQKEGL